MSIEPVDKDGVIAGGFVYELARGERGGGPVFVVPLAVENPAAGGLLGGKLADALAKLGLALRVAELHAGKLRAALVEMHVGIVEAGKNELAAEVDNLRFGAGPLLNVGGSADRDDGGSDGGDGLGLRLRRVNGPDFSAGQNEVRGGLREHRKR